MSLMLKVKYSLLPLAIARIALASTVLVLLHDDIVVRILWGSNSFDLPRDRSLTLRCPAPALSTNLRRNTDR